MKILSYPLHSGVWPGCCVKISAECSDLSPGACAARNPTIVRFGLPRFPTNQSDLRAVVCTQPLVSLPDVSGAIVIAVVISGSLAQRHQKPKQDSYTAVDGPGMFSDRNPCRSPILPFVAGKQIFMGICPTKSTSNLNQIRDGLRLLLARR